MYKCMRCCTNHIDDWRACPMVKAFEVNSAGILTRVEFLTPQDFVSKAPIDEPEYEKLQPSKA